jgi:hypothetical protein
MRKAFAINPVTGLRVVRLPDDSPVITMEHLKAVQEAIDDEDAARALCTEPDSSS